MSHHQETAIDPRLLFAQKRVVLNEHLRKEQARRCSHAGVARGDKALHDNKDEAGNRGGGGQVFCLPRQCLSLQYQLPGRHLADDFDSDWNTRLSTLSAEDIEKGD
jgi:hypothetical protein